MATSNAQASLNYDAAAHVLDIGSGTAVSAGAWVAIKGTLVADLLASYEAK